MKESKSGDFFQAMQVAVEMPARPGTVEIDRPQLPEIILESAQTLPIAVPTGCERMDSWSKLKTRVAELRNYYLPFLEEHTPPNPEPRPQLFIRRMEFRFEQDEDCGNADRPWSDSGDWQEVEIPHYTGPIGRWAAYYRVTFTLSEAIKERQRIWLCFKGVDYKCRVFLNRHYLGSHEGFFAPFEFDITRQLKDKGENTLLIRVENDAIQMGLNSWGYGAKAFQGPNIDGDKVYAGTGLGWDDPQLGWTHCPPGAGIYQAVYLEGRSGTFVHDLFVRPDIDNKKIELWLETYNCEYSNMPVKADISIYPHNFAGEALEGIKAEPAPAGPRISEYRLEIPFEKFRLWNPDEPYLYSLRVKLTAGEGQEQSVDVMETTFGMRKFHQQDKVEPKGDFYLNNKKIILRGTNEMGNLARPAMAGNYQQVIEDLLIGKAAHLNFWRLTQRPVQEEIYDLCDRLGVLIQTDLPNFGYLRKSCIEETARQAGEMERLIRSHPACVLSTFINEPMSICHSPEVWHRRVDRETLEDFLDVCVRYTRMYNPDRVMIVADGDYDGPPRYGMFLAHAYTAMHEDHGCRLGRLHAGYLFPLKKGWKTGIGEYGAEGLDFFHTMKKYYPEDMCPASRNDTDWQPSQVPKCQAWGWHHQWYDKPETAQGWINSSFEHQVWALRMMVDAHRRRSDLITMTTLHLLIDAWPNGWLKALLTVDREPKPGFFTFADAMTPLAVNLRTDRHAVWGGEAIDVELWIFNDRDNIPEGLQIVYWIEWDGECVFIRKTEANIKAYAAGFQGRIKWRSPEVNTRGVITVKAALINREGRTLHDYRLDLEVFSPYDKCLLDKVKVAVLGEPDGPARRLAERFDARMVSLDDNWKLVVADSAKLWNRESASLAEKVSAGRSALLLGAAAGESWRIGDKKINIINLVPHHFVSRKTGHKVVEGFQKNDFFKWFNKSKGYFDHIVKSGLSGEDLDAITLSGKGLWYSERKEIPATAEMRFGKGKVVADQLLVDNFIDAEPRAALYRESLLRYLVAE